MNPKEDINPLADVRQLYIRIKQARIVGPIIRSVERGAAMFWRIFLVLYAVVGYIPSRFPLVLFIWGLVTWQVYAQGSPSLDSTFQLIADRYVWLTFDMIVAAFFAAGVTLTFRVPNTVVAAITTMVLWYSAEVITLTGAGQFDARGYLGGLYVFTMAFSMFKGLTVQDFLRISRQEQQQLAWEQKALKAEIERLKVGGGRVPNADTTTYIS